MTRLKLYKHALCRDVSRKGTLASLHGQGRVSRGSSKSSSEPPSLLDKRSPLPDSSLCHSIQPTSTS